MHLQQNVENLRVCLVDFVKENDGVRTAADSFRQLAAFLKTQHKNNTRM